MNNLNLEEEIVIPAELNIDRIRKTVTKRAAKRNAIRYTRNTGIAVAASFAAVLATASFSPKVAAIAGDLPIIGHFFSDLSTHKGYIEALNNDYATDVHIIKKIDGLNLDLAYVMADEQNIILFFDTKYTDDSLKGHDITIEPDTVIDRDTNKVVENAGSTLPSLTDMEYAVSTIYMDGKKYSKNLTINVNVRDFTSDTLTPVSYDVTVDEILSAKEFNIDKEYSVKNQKFTVNKVTLYPTTALVDISFDKNNTMEFKSFDISLKNNSGDTWETASLGVTAYHDEASARYVIEGGYYSSTDTLSLNIGSVGLLPYNLEAVTYSFDDNTFTDETGKVTILDSYNEDGTIYFKLKNEANAPFFSSYVDANGETIYDYTVSGNNYYGIKPDVLKGNTAKLNRIYPEYFEDVNEIISFK